jgi:aminoglycoside phosphotransferase (APT) family kinase protein
MADDRVAAILIEPQLKRFREVCGVHGDLEANFSGWYKHVLLTADRVFLFPRHADHVAALEREAEVLDTLSPLSLSFVPRVVGRWHDAKVSPYPFIATNRLPGTPFEAWQPGLSADEMASVMASLGEKVAAWHSVDVSRLPALLHEDLDPLYGLTGRLTTEATLPDALVEAQQILAEQLDGASLSHWEPGFRQLARLEPVLVHGDLCGNQLLVDDQLAVRGVVDWGRAHVGHPLRDFLFTEWSTALYGWEGDFALFRERIWRSYQDARRVALPGHEAVHALFTIAEACWIVQLMASETGPSEWQRQRYQQSIANLRQIV